MVHLWYFDANHPLHCKSHEKLVDHLSVSLRLALGAGSSILMAALYSRVVYALWFSRSSNNEIPPQQQVKRGSAYLFSFHFRRLKNLTKCPLYFLNA